MLLEKIEQANDIKQIAPEDYGVLAEEIRQFLIQTISVTGGHLGSNLGAVELTMALHLFLNLPEDKLIWDVGHQSYTHKILTGRRDGFVNLRKFGGMSGFPKRKESDCDCFDTGHSSTSISAGLGMVKARDIQGGSQTIVSVIGDGSLTGGMAYEALNNASRLETNFIIVLNDNNMSISENVGGVSKYLNNIRTADTYLGLKEGVYNSLHGKSKYGDKVVSQIRRAKSSFKHLVVPGMFFEDMGITYLGPVDGHNIPEMVHMLKEARKVKKAVLLHVITQKGRGYTPAERHPARFHGAEPFDIETGIPSAPRTKANYTDIFSTVMCKLGQRDEKVVAITAAMPDGTGLKRFRNMYPERFFDVGIAEEHAVSFAAGLAAGGYHPVFAVYSTFLQRAYDQILHDVCLNHFAVTFAVDRAGIVGSDGETHQGIFDISYLTHIPGLVVMAPKNAVELKDMLEFCMTCPEPTAIRYPRGEAFKELTDFRAPIRFGECEWIRREGEVLFLAAGSMVKEAEEAARILDAQGIHVALVNLRFLSPLDARMLKDALSYPMVVTLEENVMRGGLGEEVAGKLLAGGYGGRFLPVALPNRFIEHGTQAELRKACGLDAESIAKLVRETMAGADMI